MSNGYLIYYYYQI